MNNSNHWQNTVADLNLLLLTCKIRHIPIKRIFDLCFSVAVLILSLPLFIIIGIIIRCTSKGAVFFVQERIGRGGIPFQCLKFRTMYRDAEDRLGSILASDPKKKEEWLNDHKLKKDPRITAIGRFLRKTSLDEFPQFWNVLKGDLSIVGPRPVVYQEIVCHYGVKANKILSIRPGITGMWQISGRSNTSYAKRIFLDEQYVDGQSMGLDLKIILKTIPCIIRARGAY